VFDFEVRGDRVAGWDYLEALGNGLLVSVLAPIGLGVLHVWLAPLGVMLGLAAALTSRFVFDADERSVGYSTLGYTYRTVWLPPGTEARTMGILDWGDCGDDGTEILTELHVPGAADELWVGRRKTACELSTVIGSMLDRHRGHDEPGDGDAGSMASAGAARSPVTPHCRGERSSTWRLAHPRGGQTRSSDEMPRRFLPRRFALLAWLQSRGFLRAAATRTDVGWSVNIPAAGLQYGDVEPYWSPWLALLVVLGAGVAWCLGDPVAMTIALVLGGWWTACALVPFVVSVRAELHTDPVFAEIRWCVFGVPFRTAGRARALAYLEHDWWSGGPCAVRFTPVVSEPESFLEPRNRWAFLPTVVAGEALVEVLASLGLQS